MSLGTLDQLGQCFNCLDGVTLAAEQWSEGEGESESIRSTLLTFVLHCLPDAASEGQIAEQGQSL